MKRPDMRQRIKLFILITLSILEITNKTIKNHLHQNNIKQKDAENIV
jgi:hypothetical protein